MGVEFADGGHGLFDLVLERLVTSGGELFDGLLERFGAGGHRGGSLRFAAGHGGSHLQKFRCGKAKLPSASRGLIPCCSAKVNDIFVQCTMLSQTREHGACDPIAQQTFTVPQGR
jgi:hypothetical protein